MLTDKGRCWVFGDDVSTDSILPSKWKTVSFEPSDLGKHAMSGIDPEFPSKVKPGDIIVGGINFGCGSSREQAPLALTGSGVRIVIARSIARIFFRNCVNVGIYPIEVNFPDGFFRSSDEISVNFSEGIINNLSTGKSITFRSIPDFLITIIESGGLKAFILSGRSYEDLLKS